MATLAPPAPPALPSYPAIPSTLSVSATSSEAMGQRRVRGPPPSFVSYNERAYWFFRNRTTVGVQTTGPGREPSPGQGRGQALGAKRRARSTRCLRRVRTVTGERVYMTPHDEGEPWLHVDDHYSHDQLQPCQITLCHLIRGALVCTVTAAMLASRLLAGTKYCCLELRKQIKYPLRKKILAKEKKKDQFTQFSNHVAEDTLLSSFISSQFIVAVSGADGPGVGGVDAAQFPAASQPEDIPLSAVDAPLPSSHASPSAFYASQPPPIDNPPHPAANQELAAANLPLQKLPPPCLCEMDYISGSCKEYTDTIKDTAISTTRLRRKHTRESLLAMALRKKRKKSMWNKLFCCRKRFRLCSCVSNRGHKRICLNCKNRTCKCGKKGKCKHCRSVNRKSGPFQDPNFIQLMEDEQNYRDALLSKNVVIKTKNQIKARQKPPPPCGWHLNEAILGSCSVCGQGEPKSEPVDHTTPPGVVPVRKIAECVCKPVDQEIATKIRSCRWITGVEDDKICSMCNKPVCNCQCTERKKKQDENKICQCKEKKKKIEFKNICSKINKLIKRQKEAFVQDIKEGIKEVNIDIVKPQEDVTVDLNDQDKVTAVDLKEFISYNDIDEDDNKTCCKERKKCKSVTESNKKNIRRVSSSKFSISTNAIEKDQGSEDLQKHALQLNANEDNVEGAAQIKRLSDTETGEKVQGDEDMGKQPLESNTNEVDIDSITQNKQASGAIEENQVAENLKKITFEKNESKDNMKKFSSGEVQAQDLEKQAPESDVNEINIIKPPSNIIVDEENQGDKELKIPSLQTNANEANVDVTDQTKQPSGINTMGENQVGDDLTKLTLEGNGNKDNMEKLLSGEVKAQDLKRAPESDGNAINIIKPPSNIIVDEANQATRDLKKQSLATKTNEENQGDKELKIPSLQTNANDANIDSTDQTNRPSNVITDEENQANKDLEKQPVTSNVNETNIGGTEEINRHSNVIADEESEAAKDLKKQSLTTNANEANKNGTDRTKLSSDVEAEEKDQADKDLKTLSLHTNANGANIDGTDQTNRPSVINAIKENQVGEDQTKLTLEKNGNKDNMEELSSGEVQAQDLKRAPESDGNKINIIKPPSNIIADKENQGDKELKTPSLQTNENEANIDSTDQKRPSNIIADEGNQATQDLKIQPLATSANKESIDAKLSSDVKTEGENQSAKVLTEHSLETDANKDTLNGTTPIEPVSGINASNEDHSDKNPGEQSLISDVNDNNIESTDQIKRPSDINEDKENQGGEDLRKPISDTTANEKNITGTDQTKSTISFEENEKDMDNIGFQICPCGADKKEEILSGTRHKNCLKNTNNIDDMQERNCCNRVVGISISPPKMLRQTRLQKHILEEEKVNDEYDGRMDDKMEKYQDEFGNARGSILNITIKEKTSNNLGQLNEIITSANQIKSKSKLDNIDHIQKRAIDIGISPDTNESMEVILNFLTLSQSDKVTQFNAIISETQNIKKRNCMADKCVEMYPFRKNKYTFTATLPTERRSVQAGVKMDWKCNETKAESVQNINESQLKFAKKQKQIKKNPSTLLDITQTPTSCCRIRSYRKKEFSNQTSKTAIEHSLCCRKISKTKKSPSYRTKSKAASNQTSVRDLHQCYRVTSKAAVRQTPKTERSLCCRNRSKPGAASNITTETLQTSRCDQNQPKVTGGPLSCCRQRKRKNMDIQIVEIVELSNINKCNVCKEPFLSKDIAILKHSGAKRKFHEEMDQFKSMIIEHGCNQMYNANQMITNRLENLKIIGEKQNIGQINPIKNESQRKKISRGTDTRSITCGEAVRPRAGLHSLRVAAAPSIRAHAASYTRQRCILTQTKAS